MPTGIGPGGFEPPSPDPKTGVLPLDEGPPNSYELTFYEPKLRAQKLTRKERNVTLLSHLNWHVSGLGAGHRFDQPVLPLADFRRRIVEFEIVLVQTEHRRS